MWEEKGMVIDKGEGYLGINMVDRKLRDIVLRMSV